MATSTPPPIDPLTEMYVFSGFCPLNSGCKKKGDRVTGYYDNYNQARDKVLRHLTKKKHHGLHQLHAELVLHDERSALRIHKVLKSTWDPAMRKANEAKHDQEANREVSSSEGEILETDVAAAVADNRRRDDRAKQGKRKPRSPSRSPRIRRSRSTSRPRDHGPPPRGRPPPAPFAAAHPAAALYAASLSPAGHAAGRFVAEYQQAAVGMWPSRDRNSSPRDVLSEALLRCELALLTAARMARQASVAFDEEAVSVGHSKLAFAMDRHKHQSSYVQFI